MGRLLRALGGVLLLILGALAGFLVEAHVEVRGVAPPLPERAVIATALVGGDGPVRVGYVNTATQQPVGHPAFVLEWADGRLFLIDAGMDRESAIAFGRLIERTFGRGPIEPHGTVPEQIGAAARRIRGVGFTHLHADHTAGLLALCAERGEPLRVYQTAFQAERLNYWTRQGRDHIQQAGCVHSERLVGGPLYPIPGFPGLVAFAAGGHTPGSTIYFARVQGRSWVFAGDISNFMEDLRLDRPKEWVYSWLIVPEATGRLALLRPWLARLDAEPDTSVVVSHDLPAIQASGLEVWQPRGP